MPATADRRRKLTDEQRENIKGLYKSRRSIGSIAKQFGVAYLTVARIVNPALREAENARKAKWNREKWKSDPEFRKEKNRRHQIDKKYEAEVKGDALKKHTAISANKAYHRRKGQTAQNSWNEQTKKL